MNGKRIIIHPFGNVGTIEDPNKAVKHYQVREIVNSTLYDPHALITEDAVKDLIEHGWNVRIIAKESK